jgi:hypothetical protein
MNLIKQMSVNIQTSEGFKKQNCKASMKSLFLNCGSHLSLLLGICALDSWTSEVRQRFIL